MGKGESDAGAIVYGFHPYDGSGPPIAGFDAIAPRGHKSIHHCLIGVCCHIRFEDGANPSSSA